MIGRPVWASGIIGDPVLNALEVIRRCCHERNMCCKTIPGGDDVGEVGDRLLICGRENLDKECVQNL